MSGILFNASPEQLQFGNARGSEDIVPLFRLVNTLTHLLAILLARAPVDRRATLGLWRSLLRGLLHGHYYLVGRWPVGLGVGSTHN